MRAVSNWLSVIAFGAASTNASAAPLVAGSHATSFYVNADGELFSWGDASNGLLGQSDPASPAVLEQPLGVTWRQISSSQNGSVAIADDGSLWTIGLNLSGELGFGSDENAPLPLPLGDGHTWLDASVCDHMLAVRSDGTLWAWGRNSFGQLGLGHTFDRSVPTQVGRGTDWVEAESGCQSSIARRANGTVWAWGLNSFGELGLGHSVSPQTVPAPVQPVTPGGFKRLFANEVGGFFAIAQDGTLWSWGRNFFGELGNGTEDLQTVPRRISSLVDWTRVSSSRDHTLAVRQDGSLWAWGHNVFGQLGTGSTTTELSPVRVGSDSDWADAAAGGYHSLARKTNGALYSFGHADPALGLGEVLVDQRVPARVGQAFSWGSLEAASDYSLATGANGALFSWGYPSLMTGGARSVPTSLLGDERFVHVHGSGNMVVAVSAGGELWTWGFDPVRESFEHFYRKGPERVGIASDWLTAAAGDSFGIALKQDGSLWVWGANTFGELGLGARVQKDQPVLNPTGDYDAIAAGRNHVLAIKSDGSLWTWGLNFDGQLGLGEGSQFLYPRPQRVGSTFDWQSVAANAAQSFAIRSDGTLWAFGGNAQGQLGLGNTVMQRLPVQVGTDADWIAVAPGGSHTLGLKADGTLWAWGSNSSGQLGLGATVSQSLVPAQVGADSDWVTVGAGSAHSLALKADGSVWSFGANEAFSLGLGAPDQTPRFTPQLVW